MPPDNKDSFFFQYGKYISIQHIKKNALIPFKDHAQFPIIVDILSRRDTHHAILCTEFSANLRIYFIEALVQHLAEENIPRHLRGVDLIYLDIANVSFNKTKQKHIENDFLHLHATLATADKYILFMLPNMHLLSSKHDSDRFLQRQFNALLAHPQCRFMVFTNSKEYVQNPHSDNQLAFVQVAAPSETDIMSILKLQRTELENFHHIVIPDELLGYAYALAERYLSTNHALEKALLLLDSSAARAAVAERVDSSNQFKSVLTMDILTHVLSGWTQIPPTNLLLHKFKFGDFVQCMQQKVFGQDTAITILGHELQQSQARLHHNISPFCSLLFAGVAHSGKSTAAIALTEQLFKQTHVLYFAQPPTPTLNSIINLKLQRCHDKHCISLKDLLRQTPYAIIMFEHIDHASPLIVDELQEILSTGYLHDMNGNQYNFRQAMIILSTTLGSNRLSDIAKSFSPEDENQHVDLLQLVMREQQNETFSAHHFSPQEIVDEVTAEIANYLPASLCQYLHVVPFLPLNKIAIEKIIRLKLKLLARTLDSLHGIELGYAPEVIRYLANDMLKKEEIENKPINIDKALKQLYFTVEQAILSQADNKNRPNQLFLQLNETGQILRCDWLAMATVRHHTT